MYCVSKNFSGLPAVKVHTLTKPWPSCLNVEVFHPLVLLQVSHIMESEEHDESRGRQKLQVPTQSLIPSHETAPHTPHSYTVWPTSTEM